MRAPSRAEPRRVPSELSSPTTTQLTAPCHLPIFNSSLFLSRTRSAAQAELGARICLPISHNASCTPKGGGRKCAGCFFSPAFDFLSLLVRPLFFLCLQSLIFGHAICCARVTQGRACQWEGGVACVAVRGGVFQPLPPLPAAHPPRNPLNPSYPSRFLLQFGQSI